MRISDWRSDVCSSDLAAADGNHSSTIGVATGDLHRVFDGFGAGGEQHAFVVGVAADQFVQAGGYLNVVLVGHYLEAGRSDERRVGQVCVSRCNSRWAPLQ